MADYVEIEDPGEIDKLNRKLAAKLKGGLRFVETRAIGGPAGGPSSARVRFLSRTGDQAFWWCSELSGAKKALRNLFGHGRMGNRVALNIDVQVNFPGSGFSRRRNGSFLRETSTGDMVLAHRGIVNLGRSHIRRATLLSRMETTVREAETSVGPLEFLLVGKLDSPTLVRDIDSFSSDLRRIKGEFASDRSTNSTSSSATGALLALRPYFDEFSGRRKVTVREPAIADCYHGNVVRALRDEFGKPAEVFKNRDVDLVALDGERVLLFEVKTSSGTQSLYTAVGQLALHSPAVAERLSAFAVTGVIVLPSQPSDRIRRLLTEKLKIEILTFSRSAQGKITIHGLQKLR